MIYYVMYGPPPAKKSNRLRGFRPVLLYKFPIIMVNVICMYISDVPTDSKIKKSPVEHTRQYITR